MKYVDDPKLHTGTNVGPCIIQCGRDAALTFGPFIYRKIKVLSENTRSNILFHTDFPRDKYEINVECLFKGKRVLHDLG